MEAFHGGEDGRELQGDSEVFPESGRHSTDGRFVGEGPGGQTFRDDPRAVDLPLHLQAPSNQRISRDESKQGPAKGYRAPT